MVQERLNAAAKHPQNQDQLQQEGIKLMEHIMSTHKIFDPGPKEQFVKRPSRPKEVSEAIELNLDNEWQQQSQKLIELGFHKELNLSEQEYLESLPKFESQPKEYKGRFDVPLLVETRIPWQRQAELAQIALSDFLREKIDQTKPCDQRSQPPDKAYAGWFNQWGQRFTNKISPFDARNQLTDDEIGSNPFDGIAQQIHYPEVTTSGKYFDLIGYNVGSAGVVDLYRWHGGPRLDAAWGGRARDRFRPLVRGSKIVIG